MRCSKQNDNGNLEMTAEDHCLIRDDRENVGAQNRHVRRTQRKTTAQRCKLLEPDGRKIGISSDQHNNGDMSRASERLATFKEFPKKNLSSKISDSGYYYIGEDDKTICHKCHAVVSDWYEKDNPATFHEPHCEYHEGAMDEDKQPSLEGTSLLDIPITEDNSISPVPTILQPTIATTIPTKSEKSFPHSISVITGENEHSRSSPRYQSLPVAGTSWAVLPPATKHFVQPGEVIEEEHEAFLKTLNLFSEEERRKTFSINNCWENNTNDVLPYKKLAKDGFFYLGNLDRTKCFSCLRVFNKWQRKDKISSVHKSIVAQCKMVNGKEKRNIPYQEVLDIGERGFPSKQLLSGNSSTFSICDSNESALEISPIPLPTHGSNDELTHNPMPGSTDPNEATFSAVNQPSQFGVPGYLSGPNDPVHSASEQSTRNFEQKEPASVQQSTTSASLPDPSELSVRISAPSTSQQSTINPGSPSLPYFPTPAVQIRLPPSEMPLDLTMRQSANAGAPAGSSHEELYTEGHSTSSATDKDHYPVQVSMEENEEHSGTVGHPEIHAPSHLGQTTLYTGAPGPQTNPNTLLSFQNAPATTQGEWAEVFPCQEPDADHMRSTIMRQETFDYSWAMRGIGFTDEMARAGFYSTGDGDRVKCWYCGGAAHHWTPQDDPWEEHAKLYPNCEYLLQQKGPDYVSEVSTRHRAARPPTPVAHFRRSPSVASNSSESPYSSMEEVSPGPFRGPYFSRSPFRMFPHHAPSPPRFVDPREQEVKRKQMIEAALSSEHTLTAVEMGFDRKVIKKAIKRKVRSTDSPFSNLEELLDAILNHTEDSESSDSENEGGTSAPPTSNMPGTSTSNMEVTSSSTSPVGGEGEETRPRKSPLEGSGNLDPKKLEGRLREYEQEKRCKVCLDRDAEVVFVPCGHLCTCVKCANALRTCPLCRRRIQTAMKIYTA